MVGKTLPLKFRKMNPNSKYWLKKADSEWGKFIHKKYDGCLVCGRKTGKLDAHHLITKGSNTFLRHNPNNGVLLCVHHHKWDNKLSAHGTPNIFKQFLKKEHEDIYNWMIANRWRKGKSNYKNNYFMLKKMNEELKNAG